jgi:hypothetical protein
VVIVPNVPWVCIWPRIAGLDHPGGRQRGDESAIGEDVEVDELPIGAIVAIGAIEADAQFSPL